ncbi:MAG: transglycosylase SLT domain-containing protein [Terriglobales bacterium]
MTLRNRFVPLLLALALASGSAYPQSSTSHSTTHINKTHTKKKTAAKKKSKTSAARVQKTAQAFVRSLDLRAMATQLLQNRSKAAYDGVEHYALTHPNEAGALAWFAIGYAHTLDQEFAQAIPPLLKAPPKAGELGDYVDFYLGKSYHATSNWSDCIATLQDFSTKYPDSLNRRDAAIVYGNALLAAGKNVEAAKVLEAERTPLRSDVELYLGRALARSGHPNTAAVAFQHVYYGMPLSDEADAAGDELDRLQKQSKIPAASFSVRRQRPELLVSGKRYSEAIEDYKRLLQEAPATDAPALRLGLAVALYRDRRYKDAKDLLQKLSVTGETPLSSDQKAERLYYLGEITRGDDQIAFVEYLSQLRAIEPAGKWLEESLISTGNSYLLKKDIATAAKFYSELATRVPNGKYGSYAHWKAAWITYRLNDFAGAKQQFEEQISLYPNSAEVANALYWRARIAEQENDPAKARAYYQKLAERFRYYYYGELARDRMAQIKFEGPADPDPLLRKIPAIKPPQDPRELMPADNLRAQRSRLLQNGGLTDLAVKELQTAGYNDSLGWANQEILRLYQNDGAYYRALQVAKRSVPGYFAFELTDMPRPFWEALFPRVYWTDLKKYSQENALDPFMVASLIRQESEFNPSAVSRAKALGLMQLLPSVGKHLAKEVKLGGFNQGLLFVPPINLRLGTRYFKQMVDQNAGTVEFALAAYNAGQDRVDDWRKDAKFRDVPEFVESIPFTETREYVQAIVRNAGVYRRLYSEP